MKTFYKLARSNEPNYWLKPFAPLTRDRHSRPLSQTLGEAMLRMAPDYIALLNLQEELNLKLKNAYECEVTKGEDHLANFLIYYVENLVNELNKNKWSFARHEYSGDKNFRHSEQWWSDGHEPGEGTLLHFIGFSVQVESLT